MKRKWKKSEIIILTILFTGYLIFNGVLLAGHELWRDEANVWLLARELSPLQLLKELKYQGHPCLWYLIAMPFAKLGFPFKTLSLISYFVMSLTAGVFTFQAPFHRVTKFACLVSPVFSYYYPVVARNYCLIALILMTLAFIYPKRNEKPLWYGLLLGLMVQADTIALATSGLISFMWLWESVCSGIRTKKWTPVITAVKGLWIPLASLFLWIAEFRNVSDSPEFRLKTMSVMELLREIRNFSYSILTRMTGMGQAFDLFLIVLFLIIGVLISIKKKNCWPAIVMAGTFLFEVMFSIMVYQLHIWHYIAIVFALIWFLWVGNCLPGIKGEKREGRQRIMIRILSEMLLALLSVTMFLRWNSPEENSSLGNALYGLYSDGVNAAAYIRQNIAEDELIFSTNVSESSTVLAYLGKEYTFYYAGSQKKAVYADYTDDQKVGISYEELLDFVRNNYPEKNAFYILESPGNCISDIPGDVKEEFVICYQTAGETARGESYTLYRVSDF